MDKTVRISVRELVAFSYFTEDILPTGGVEVMHTGTKAHQARQTQSGGEVEKTIQHSFAAEGLSVLVYGRMDVLFDGDVPLVEEIKLGGERDEALPEHRAQALCYAAMLSQEKPCEAVSIRVCYVDESGQAQCAFEETLSADELEAAMQALLLPWVRFAKRELAHRAKRDESLQSLAFPFASYRKGQRELAVQVYTAIRRKKRLFASLPTGTGKSAAVLYPALKALGEGETEKVLYLTARGTARQSPLSAIESMQGKGMHARCCVLTAKEKLCPAPTRCHPDFCARARGHYLRQRDAVEELLDSGLLLWDETAIRILADKYQICPFELALALTELADVVMMDVNYVFDPFAQIKRLYQRKSRCTLLIDEAHHLVDRVRESLSGTLDSYELSRIRAAHGKEHGRKTALYRTLGVMIKSLRALEAENERLESLPPESVSQVQQVLEAAMEMAGQSGVQEIIRICLPFLYAAEHLDEDYAVLLEKHGRERTLTLYCLLPGKAIAQTTKGMRGTVFFSATLAPLPAMKQLLGGAEEDACFSLPSPFPRENLAVARVPVNTRYERRKDSAQQVAQVITQAVQSRKGSYIAFFPSYAYLNTVREHLEESALPTLWVQRRDMTETDRAAFLDAFAQPEKPKLGLCVLGGVFSEGIDLPGEKLIGAMIVGVGLPVPSVRVNAVRECYQRHFGDGFAFACRIPGMQKALQAAGRVIRSETDRGMVVLLDERYFWPEYEALLPGEWRLAKDISQAIERLEALP